MISEAVSVLAGALAGALTGLLPVHVNAVLPFIATMTGIYALPALVIGLAVSHTLFSFFPAVFLFAPSDETALLASPAQQQAAEGKAADAFASHVSSFVIGAVAAMVLLRLLSAVPGAGALLKVVGPVAAALTIAAILWSERTVEAWLVFFASAALAWFVFASHGLSSTAALTALFTGFFGLSTALASHGSRKSKPQRKPSGTGEPRDESKPAIIASFTSALASLLPAASPSVAAIVSKRLFESRNTIAANSSAMGAYLVGGILSFALIGNPRSAAGVLVSGSGASELTTIACLLIALGASALVARAVSGPMVRFFSAADPRALRAIGIASALSVSFLLGGLPGLLVLSSATCIGLAAITARAPRSLCMGSLLLPALLYFLNGIA